MANVIQPVVTLHWVTVKKPGKSIARTLATQINERIFKHSHQTGIYGFAKPSYIEGQWQVGVYQVKLNNSPSKTVESSYRTKAESLVTVNDQKFAPLLEEVKRAVEKVERNPDEVINPYLIEKKLQKLIIYIFLAPRWPYDPNRTPIEAVVDTFKRISKFFNTKHLTPQNQEKFNNFITALAMHLKQESMRLRDYNIKILTKVHAEAPKGAHSFQLMQGIFKAAVERIIWPEHSPRDSISEFCEIFATHSYFYKPDADTEAARNGLQERVNRLVELLVDYDLENSSSLLFKFMMVLLKSIQSQGNSKNTLFSKAYVSSVQSHDETNLQDLSVFSPLVWSLEALVNNQQCIEYLRSSGRVAAQRQEDIITVALALFEQEYCWQPLSKYIVFLGNVEIFDRVLIQKIEIGKAICSMTQQQLNHIFLFLNDRLAKETDVSMVRQYKTMTRQFLNRLATANYLHHLRTYTERSEHFEQLRRNLIQLGFQVMEDQTLELVLFFSNPAYRALETLETDSGNKVRRSLLRLFTKYAPNKIASPKAFAQILKMLTHDFRTEYEHFAEKVLSQIGQLSPPGVDKTPSKNLISVEEWLQSTVAPIYQQLKQYVLRCVPLTWGVSTFNGIEILKNRLCLYEGAFYLVTVQQGRLELRNLFNHNPVVNLPKEIEYSDDYSEVKTRLKRELSNEANRNAISNLTEQFMSCAQTEDAKFAIQPLLSNLFDMMKSDSVTPMNRRILIVANFLKDLAPFLNTLNQYAISRFFPDDKLKLKLVLNLRHKALANDLSISTTLEQLQSDSPDTYTEELQSEIIRIISLLCLEEIREILSGSSLAELSQIIAQFEAVLFRKFDELSYTTEEFVQSFSDRNQIRAGSSDLATILEDLPIRESLMQDFGAILKTRKPAVNFILPNQAIAIRLCESSAFAAKNLLLKLGTGQGKSIVIAVSALLEARAGAGNNGKVFVFTSYDYLARRDHELGSKFFGKESISSMCISDSKDVAKFNNRIQIIYADIEQIDSIVREIILRLLENHATSSEKLFLQAIYSSSTENSIILDEYDLLLYDLETKSPFGMSIPQTLLTTRFVDSKSAYCSWLPSQIEKNRSGERRQRELHLDGATGKGFSYRKWHDYDTGFHLSVSVTRISSLMKRAKRVIGLSGTAIDQEAHGLSSPLFFELPSSQNPKAFETVIQRDASPPITEFPYIARTEVREFPTLTKANSTDKFFTATEAAINEYCDAIIRDVKKVQEPIIEEKFEYKRPVLIFVDPTIKYKIQGSTQDAVRLWDTLKSKMRAAGITGIGELEDDKTDEQLQEIVSRSGHVTLSTIKYGRGADIRTNANIKLGLHVIVGTQVIHKQVLDQLIGRTGRMGRSGSYSIFTLGQVIKPVSAESHRSSEYYAALHELTGLFIHRIIRVGFCSQELAGKWLMFITQCCYNSKEKINRQHALELCGVSQIGEDIVPAKFLE